MSNLLEYFNGDDLAASVWQGKYALKDSKKRIIEQSPEEMHLRMAKEFARVEYNYVKNTPSDEQFACLSDFGKNIAYKNTLCVVDNVYNYFNKFKYIVPQGSIMSMLGNEYAVGSLSNCFVVPAPLDSYAGILTTDQHLVQLMKRRGGVGTNLNELRPDDTYVNNAAGSSTGAHSFMDRYSNTTREVAQNGRRGALMLLMSVLHPDIFKFVSKKKDRTKVTGANISVMLTDEFMKAAENDEDFYCRFPVNCKVNIVYPDPSKLEYNKLLKVDSDNKDAPTHMMKIKARELFDLIVENAWENAEPGIAFMDRVENYSPEGVYEQFKAIASNPCGEQWMQAFDACRLLALNLFSCVVNPFTKDAYIDYDKLYEISYIQQRLADDIVDLELEYVNKIIEKIKADPEPIEIKRVELELWENIYKTAYASRRTGCGFTGLGDMLAALSLKYDSDEALQIIESVMKKKMEAELDCTIDLGILRGTFEGWDPSLEKV